jgi:hypothetical protein
MRFHKKINLFILFLTAAKILTAQTVITYPDLPIDSFRSQKYQVRVKTADGSYKSSFVLGEKQLITNINNKSVRDAMSDYNHWTTFSFDKNVQVEVSNTEGVKTCEIFPKRYGITPTIANGKIQFTIPKPNSKLYLLINGDEENPLFIFADPLETNVPKPTDKGVLYFKAGVHELGIKHKLPDNIHTVYLEGGAYVRGSIFFENRSNIKICGRGILSGDGYEFADNKDGMDKADNISKSAICQYGSGKNILVEGITIMRPLKFSVVLRGSGRMTNVKCLGWNYTVDGVVAGDKSEVDNCFFKVNDDVVKLYSDDMYVHDLVVYHQTNGAIFQLGWSGQKGKNCRVERIDIVKDETVQDNEGKGNHSIINWRKCTTKTLHSDHVFDDIRADRGYCRLIGINLDIESDGSFENILIKNVHISGTSKYKSYANTASGKIGIRLENVTVNGACLTQDGFSKQGNVEIVAKCQ